MTTQVPNQSGVATGQQTAHEGTLLEGQLGGFGRPVHRSGPGSVDPERCGQPLIASAMRSALVSSGPMELSTPEPGFAEAVGVELDHSDTVGRLGATASAGTSGLDVLLGVAGSPCRR